MNCLHSEVETDRATRYADQSALDGHMSSAAVQNLIKVFTEQGASLFAAPTDVYANNSMFSMAKPKLNQSPNPYIVFAQIKFKEGTKAQGLDGLKDVIKSARNDETSTLAYNVLEDKEDLHKLRIVSAYDSETAYRNEHLQAIAVKENEQRNKPNWENLTFWPLKLVAGYMHKGRLPNHSGL